MTESKLEQLARMTTVVADTGDLDAIRQWQPQDATTNPSLLLKATELDAYRPMAEDAINWARTRNGDSRQQLEDATDRLAVLAGKEILGIVPGVVSTEVDARLSFDTQATIDRARKLIRLYEELDTDPGRVLIKIASTWEGIQAARVLERDGIRCNLTLLFSFHQAMACADAGAYLVSPFVGRILDWHLAARGLQQIAPDEDPGVLSVTRIYNYFKAHNYDTIVMGASFRNRGEIERLAGCDRLTISPALLKELAEEQGELPRQLAPESVRSTDPLLHLDERQFRWQLNEDAMATEKLAEGIRRFAADQITLEQRISGQAKAA